jgi:hypothetical protein
MASTPTRGSAEWKFDEEAFLKKIPHPVTPTNLKGVYVGAAPPDGFDANKASSAELVKNGILWRRPKASDPPAVRAAWDKVFSRKWLPEDRIVPVLEPQVGRTHVLRKPGKKVNTGNYLFYGWSGAATASGGPYVQIMANWRVPAVTKAPEPASSEGSHDFEHGIAYDSASWIGIDGYQPDPTMGSTDILQAGVEQYVDVSGQAHYVAWYEWFVPYATAPPYVFQTNISNLLISPGDEIDVSVSYTGSSVGTIYISNATTKKYIPGITLAPPPGATFIGDTVEWIMEDPDGGEESGNALAKFTPVEFTSAIACTAAGEFNNPEFDDMMNIETLDGTTLTQVTLGDNTVTVNFIG